jgi:hypothetical protein
VTVEEGVQRRPRGPNNGYLGPQLNPEEEKDAEQEVIRPSKAYSTRHFRSNQVRLLHENTTQLRDAEPEPTMTREMTAGGKKRIIYDTNPPPQGAPPEFICETQFYKKREKQRQIL